MKPATRTSGQPAVFVQQLHRAAAQRGRLDPVYQDLSDHWTMVLQRLYPVWALVGPGLSDPGHIEIHSRTVYLDSEALLGSRAAIAAGQLEQRAILRCFGVALHETMHAKHTKRWAVEHDVALSESDDPADRQLAVDRRLLEEPRMEAHGVREFLPDSVRGRFVRRALQAAVTDVIVPAFTGQVLGLASAGQRLTRDLAARATVYLRARTEYGIVDPADLTGLGELWRPVLGEHDLRALDDLYARLVWIPDGELERLDEAAREYRQIVGEPDPPPSAAGAGGAGGAGGSGEGGGGADSGEGDGPRSGGEVKAGSLADALEEAIATARAGQLEQLDEDLGLGQLLERAAGEGEERGKLRLGRGRGTGLPTGRLPDRGVDRPPYPDEVQHARRYATRLRQAITRGTRQIDNRTPGGRFDGRAYARGRAEEAAGRPVTTHPWRVTRQVAAPIQEPHVGLIIDTSGSMAGYEYALGPIAWILTDGLRQIGGRCATALFGNSAALLADGTQPLPRVPGIRTGGGTAFAGDAIELVSDQLEMTNPRRPRFVYVLSDGGWSDTRAGVERIRELAELGVPTIHLSIGIAPLSVECDRITVIIDPAQALDYIAADTVAALTARQRRPRGR
jgi:Mg-chelatase subunit ChlD